ITALDGSSIQFDASLFTSCKAIQAGLRFSTIKETVDKFFSTAENNIYADDGSLVFSEPNPLVFTDKNELIWLKNILSLIQLLRQQELMRVIYQVFPLLIKKTPSDQLPAVSEGSEL